eukprot:5549475-Pleurochrysis_carterae.AAC.1
MHDTADGAVAVVRLDARIIEVDGTQLGVEPDLQNARMTNNTGNLRALWSKTDTSMFMKHVDGKEAFVLSLKMRAGSHMNIANFKLITLNKQYFNAEMNPYEKVTDRQAF